MYAAAPWSVHPDLVELAGADAIVTRARTHFDAGRLPEALHLLDVVLKPKAEHAEALQLRIETCKLLSARTENVIEQGWLAEFVRRDEQSLKRLQRKRP